MPGLLSRILPAAVAAFALAPGRVAGQAPRYARADVEFMQGMIAHHAQALDMVALVPDRTTTESIRLLAQRIDISQRDEIRLMRSWLTERGQAAPDPVAAHGHRAGAGHEMLMPGMLTGEQMARLAAVKGAEFDRLFLQLMIQHHQGALTMVKTLFGTQGAAQETPTFRYASGVDTDQRFEIERMQKLLARETRP
ncbi:MAG TPA: DUF305 domain-containing protein [Gemmatimonadales bacterium]